MAGSTDLFPFDNRRTDSLSFSFFLFIILLIWMCCAVSAPFRLFVTPHLFFFLFVCLFVDRSIISEEERRIEILVVARCFHHQTTLCAMATQMPFQLRRRRRRGEAFIDQLHGGVVREGGKKRVVIPQSHSPTRMRNEK